MSRINSRDSLIFNIIVLFILAQGECFTELNRLGLLVILSICLSVVLFERGQVYLPYQGFNINDKMANGMGLLQGIIPFLVHWWQNHTYEPCRY